RLGGEVDVADAALGLGQVLAGHAEVADGVAEPVLGGAEAAAQAGDGVDGVVDAGDGGRDVATRTDVERVERQGGAQCRARGHRRGGAAGRGAGAVRNVTELAEPSSRLMPLNSVEWPTRSISERRLETSCSSVALSVSDRVPLPACTASSRMRLR